VKSNARLGGWGYIGFGSITVTRATSKSKESSYTGAGRMRPVRTEEGTADGRVSTKSKRRTLFLEGEQ